MGFIHRGFFPAAPCSSEALAPEALLCAPASVGDAE